VIFSLGLDGGWGSGREVVDTLVLQGVLIVPQAFVVVSRLKRLDLRHVHDMNIYAGEADHRGRLEPALEPDGNVGLGTEGSAATSGEMITHKDLNS